MDGRGWNTGAQPPVEKRTTESPFEEPEQAPELRNERSENLYTRSEPFWNSVADTTRQSRSEVRDANYWNHPDVMDTDRLLHVDTERGLDKLRKFLGDGATKKFLAIFAVIAVVAFVLYGTLFRVRTINVVGNSQVHAQEIVRLSGLKEGQNSLSIDDEAVMRKVESNRYLRCTLVDVQWNSVTIHVKEREPVAYLNHNGMVIQLDNRGFVLEEALMMSADVESMVKVIGLDVRRCALGQTISLNQADQLETYTQVLVELKAMKGLDLLRELDMSSMESIYLAIADKFYVRLGSSDNIHEKLRAFMITRDKVIEMGYDAGTIDVTNPGQPTFAPN